MMPPHVRLAVRVPDKNQRVPQPAGGRKVRAMAESVYKIIELVGTSTESWEKAAAAAVAQASKTLRDLRIAEVAELDMQVQNGKVKAYRAKLKVSFKFEGVNKK
jgi:dodecin